MNPTVIEALRLAQDALAWYERNYNALTPMAINDLISLKRRYDALVEPFDRFKDLDDAALAAIFFPPVNDLKAMMPAWLQAEFDQM